MTTAAIYARVSSQRQKEEQTITSQTAALKEHAAQLGLEVPAEWVFEDEGYSGATLVRPALERLRDLAAQVSVEVVLCYSPDRLARKYAYQALLIEEFARVGSEIRFVKGPKADTPEDELLLQFQGMIAEYEKAQIIERTRRGKIHRARSGSVNVLGGAPYGYRYVKKTEDADARYEILEHQAEAVREIFLRYVEDGLSIAALAQWLTEQEVPTATGKRIWDRSVVWAMLKNPAYRGVAAFGKTLQSGDRPKLNRVARLQGRTTPRRAHSVRASDEWIEIPVPAIVSNELFELAARRLEDNKRFATRRTKEPTLLQSLLVCDGCGYAYYRTSTRTSARKLYYYRCLGSDDYRYEHGRVCDGKPVRQDHLDRVVWEHITALLSDPALIQQELDRRLTELRTVNPTTAQKSRLELELTRTTMAMTRLVEAYQEGLLSLDELRSRMPALRKNESTVRSQINALEAQLLDRETYLKLAENLESFLARLRDAATSSSVEDRQRVLRLIVKEVLVGPERIVIRHSIPTPGSDPTPGYLLRGGTQDAALGSAGDRRPVSPLLHDPRFEPQADELQHLAVRDASGRRLQQQRVVDAAETICDVHFEHVGVTVDEALTDDLECLGRRAARPIAVGARQEIGLEDRLQHDLGRLLHDAIPDGRDAEWPFASVSFRDEPSPHRCGTVGALSEVGLQLVEHALHAVDLHVGERLTIDACRTSVAPDPLPCRPQDVTPVDAVVKGMETATR